MTSAQGSAYEESVTSGASRRCPATVVLGASFATTQSSYQCKHERGHDGKHAAFSFAVGGDVLWPQANGASERGSAHEAMINAAGHAVMDLTGEFDRPAIRAALAAALRVLVDEPWLITHRESALRVRNLADRVEGAVDAPEN